MTPMETEAPSSGPNRGDHIDWASARFARSDSESLPGPATNDGVDPGGFDPSAVGQEGIQWSTPPGEPSQQVSLQAFAMPPTESVFRSLG